MHMHKPAKMLCLLLQQMLLALVLMLNGPFANSPNQLITALPITSKPIESTAENLAWQAWIMLPPQQQNLEKSRKVTPKSIFILPNRSKLPATTTTNDGGQFLPSEMGSGYAPIDCPPGQQQFESRCIPTVNIDRDQLLIQELQILFPQSGSGASNQGSLDYDYDYDNDGSIPMVGGGGGGGGNFEPPLMLNGGEPSILIGNNYDDADRLPIEDAPLKFNIFREKFPTDGASAAENSNETIGAFDPMAIVENGTVPEGWQAINITDLWTDLANKMQMQNADEPAGSFFPEAFDRSAEKAEEETTHSSTTIASVTNSKANSSQDFALSNIDAIMLPAVAAATIQSHQNHHQQQQQQSNKQQQFAIFKDDSTMQLFTADHKNEDDRRSTTAQQQKTTEIMELLKVDALLPMHDIAATGTTVTRSTVTPLPFFGAANAVAHKDDFDDDVAAATTTDTTFPTPMAEMLEEVKSHTSQEREKDEHTRSVTLHTFDDDLTTTTTTDEIESDPLTTTMTVTATGGDDQSTPNTANDELSTFTFPSSSDAVAALQFVEANAEDPSQQEIVAITEQEDPANRLNDISGAAAHEVHKKSKVEPVGDDGVDDEQSTTPLPTPPEFDMLVPPPEVESSKNALTNVAAAVAINSNRFKAENTVTVVGAKALNNELVNVESKITTTTTITNTATTMRTSEIDIATELRLINELVKGKRQGTATKTTTTTTMAPATTTKAAVTESTTTTTKSNTASIKNNNNNDDNSKQETPTAATSVKTLPTTTTIKNDVETTTTTTDWLLNAKSGTTTPSHINSIESGNIVTDTEEEELNLVSNSTPTTTTESTATIWSKILPFLSFGSTTTSSSTTADADNQNTSENVNENRSNRRNSKIIRINNLSANSLSDVKSSKIATTTTTIATASSTTTTTTELPPTTTTSIIVESSSPPTFWWLPIGWSLEPSATSDAQPVVTPFRRQTKNAVTPVASSAPTQSLLLRFWNAFPGNQKRS